MASRYARRDSCRVTTIAVSGQLRSRGLRWPNFVFEKRAAGGLCRRGTSMPALSIFLLVIPPGITFHQSNSGFTPARRHSGAADRPWRSVCVSADSPKISVSYCLFFCDPRQPDLGAHRTGPWRTCALPVASELHRSSAGEVYGFACSARGIESGPDHRGVRARTHATPARPSCGRTKSDRRPHHFPGFVLIKCSTSLLFSLQEYSSSSGRPGVGLRVVRSRSCFQGLAYISGSSTVIS